ncbi:hypothetical protein V2J09_001061 [Rumex salicifolius]
MVLDGLFESIDLFTLLEDNWDFNFPKLDPPQQNLGCDPPVMTPLVIDEDPRPPFTSPTSSTRPARRRRRARRSKKTINGDEIETQRMTHIAVERNRRKQMNELLSQIKSMIPHSYAQRGDQASIVGGAIDFVKELEQKMHCLSAQKTQYKETNGAADVEVAMVETYANLKIRLLKRPKQLISIISGINGLRLSILHLSLSTVDQYALYSLSIKVENDSKVNSADEIATAMHQLLGRMDEERRLN